MHRLPPLLAILTQITRHSRAGAALLIASLAVVLFTGPPASAQSGSGGLNQVTVSFHDLSLYIVDEGGTRSFYVSLSDDPGREVIIPITATGLGGASPADYSGVPQTVTFGRAAECFDSAGDIIQGGICYETSKYFTFMAEQDAVDDDGESVLLGFGAPLPAGVSAGWVATETVTIADGGRASVGLAQVGIGVTAGVGVLFGNVSNEAWQWQRSATEYGAYSDIPAAEGGTSNPYTPSAGDLGMWLKAKGTYDVGSSTGQTAQATTLQPVLSQAALSNAGFAYYSELSYFLEPPTGTANTTPVYAQGFTTGSDTSGYLLTAVRLSIRTAALTVAGAWAVHADDAGKPAADPLSAARPILNTGVPPEYFTFREFTHPEGVHVDPDTKYWIVISQTTSGDDGAIGIAAWGEWTGALEEGLATPPVDPGSEDGWSVDFEALAYYWDDPTDPYDDIPFRPELLPWETFGTGLDLDGRLVLRMALRVAPEVTVQFSQDSYTVAEGGTQSVTVTLSADPERTLVIPIEATNQGGATSADYSGVPSSVTFNDGGPTEMTFTFMAVDDTLDDDDESVKLAFGTLPDEVSAVAPTETTFVITDDDVPAVTVTFGQGTYTVAEGATQSVTVTLSADPERTVVVPIATVNQGTTSDADYSGVPSSVTFDAGETSKSFTFSATQDTEDDDDESVQLVFGSLPDAALSAGAPGATTINITDDDVPAVTVQFSQGSYVVAEGATQSVTVTLSANPERTVIIPITTVNQGTASDGDYSGVPSGVTFLSGETSKSFDFSATQDTEDDDGESVRLGFGSMPDARVSAGTPDETTVNITDDDVPAVTVSFGQGSYTVAEGATQSVTVTLSADPERSVIIPITTVNQSTTSDTDYSGVPLSVTFDAGETSKSFDFSATQDTEDDDGESVRLGFGSMPDARVSAGTPDETTVNITDDDVPSVTVSFGQGTYTVAEGATQSLTVTLSANPERTVIIPITTVNQGTASDGDYSGVPSSVTFQSGETSKSFDFSATQDTEDDDGESVRLGFGSMPDARVSAGTPDETTVNITDDDVPAVTVSFGQGTYTVAEGATQSLTVTLSANPERTVIIPITTVNQGTASDGDYSGVPSSVTFQSGETSKSFDFSATQDTEDDDGESVRLGFGSLPDARVSAGTPDETTVNITDDDVPAVTVSFGQGSYSVAEGGTVTVRVTLSADPERSVTIPITTLDEGGASNSDYSGVPANVTFNAGEREQTFAFRATQDDLDDDDESVKLGFGNLPANVSTRAPDATTVAIADDDVPAVTVSFGQGAYSVAEGGTVTVRVTLSADPERTVAIPITTLDEGGASNSDYSGVPANVTFNAGETAKTFAFRATQDTEDDDDESVRLGFGNLPTGVSEGATGETVVSITDDDVPAVTVGFGSATYSVAEGGTVTVGVTLSADPERSVSIPITTLDEGGASNSDYSGVPANVTFNAGETAKTFAFRATQDTEDDDDESVKLGFGNLPANVSTRAPDATTVAIADDDVPAVTVSFGQGAYSVAEGGTVTVRVTLSADPERSVSIPITTLDEGGASNSDYSGVPANVVFASGETAKTITFSATQDTEDDDSESVRMGFGNLPTGVSEGSTRETVVSITDDDVPAVTVSFGQGSYSVAEGGTVTVGVTLSADPERTVTIPITTMNEGGATQHDYSGVPANVTFAPGETAKTITFSATQDTEDDDSESVRMGFGTLPTGVTEAATGETVVSITDDDVPAVTVSFGQGSYSVAEGGTVTVGVTLSADPERSVSIPITTLDEGGASNSDYSGVPANVTFAPGETAKTFTFSATQDTEDDDSESVKLGFGNLPTGVSEGSTRETVVSITDDDVPAVTVSFGQGSYSVAEGGTVTVRVTLSADPERSVTIPITTRTRAEPRSTTGRACRRT